MNKNFLFTIFFVFLYSVVYAGPIDEGIARKVAETFMSGQQRMQHLYPTDLTLAYKSVPSGHATTLTNDNIVYFYVFNSGNEGFVIVSGEDSVIPVLGYSDEGVFDGDNIPQEVMKWLEGYKNQIRYAIENDLQPTAEILQDWKDYIDGNTDRFAALGTTAVNPLITTKWNQSPYFNALCPYDNAKGARTVTGCVATAMAQIMKFWNHPANGTGFHSYNHPRYGTLSANFGSTTYQWSSMPNRVTSNNDAVATLMYQCGVSIDMNYGVSAEGGSGAATLDVADALKNYFGYASTVKGIHRANYTETQWKNLIKSELDAGRPVQYAGTGSGGGHSFVCDGYDNNGYFHFNWGWGGSSDGYFTVNALNPGTLGTGGGTGGFNSNQRLIYGIKPGGSTENSTDIRLYSSLTMPSTKIWFTSSFGVSADVANYGSTAFSGQLGAAVFDASYNFVDFIETTEFNISSMKYRSMDFINDGSPKFVPGKYYIALFFKSGSSGWTIVGDGSYTNLIALEFFYSANIEVNSKFTITNNNGKLIQGQTARINVDVLNTGNSTFYGDIRVNLANLTGSWAQNIAILNESRGLPPNYHYTDGMNFENTITVEPGTYLMEVAFREEGSSSWYYAGSSDYSNPIYVIVEESALSPDSYEPNNSASAAYKLPLSFSGNSVTINTSGSNCHNGVDYDYYKIQLPSGYSYKIVPRLHDSYNSGNGKSYSLDALFSYSVDGSKWSDAYDDVFNGSIDVNGGKTVYFFVSPYYTGETGTYLLDLKITRSPSTAVEIIDDDGLVNVFPNPAQDFINIDFDRFPYDVSSVSVYDVTGNQIIYKEVTKAQQKFRLETSSWLDGVYFVVINTDQGLLTKKIIIKR